MHKLTHFALCPFSRSVRLMLGELRIESELLSERPWEWRAEFLSMNPAGELPVLQIDGGPILCGAYAISEYVADEVRRHPAEDRGVPLFPGNSEERAEVRRLVDWFHCKFDREVTRELLTEKVYPRFSQQWPAHKPDPEIMRATRANLRHHLAYVSYLADVRRWLAGEEMSFADLAAAAHLSVVDYIDEAPWQEFPRAKGWYARLKSRPSFRDLLADRIPGAQPPAHYAELDF